MKKLFLCICGFAIFCTMLTSCTKKANNKPLQMAICAVEGCGLEADLDSKYCEEHICVEEDCYELRTEGSEVNGYCKAHKCKNEDCFNKKTYESEFCEEHSCANPECISQQEKGEWCAVHICEVEGCLNGVDTGTEVCEEHKCPVENCTNVLDGATCKYHKCKIESCAQIVTMEGYCQTHYEAFCLCGRDGCTNKAESGSSACAEHNCSAPGCKTLCFKDNLCPEHYYQKNPIIRQ